MSPTCCPGPPVTVTGVQVGVAAVALLVLCTVPFCRPTQTVFESIASVATAVIGDGNPPAEEYVLPLSVLRKSVNVVVGGLPLVVCPAKYAMPPPVQFGSKAGQLR